MYPWTRLKWLAFSIVNSIFLSCSLCGCFTTDLSGYHTVSKSAEKQVENRTGAQNASSNEAGDASSNVVRPSPESPAESPKSKSDAAPISALTPSDDSDVNEVRPVTENGDSGLKTDGSAANSTPASTSDETSKTTEPSKTTETGEYEILIKDKTFRPEKKTKALRVSFAPDLDLEKVMNMKQVTEGADKLMPDWLKNLSGKTVVIRGFMKPTYTAEGIEMFALARDTQQCCFGPDPKIDYLILVTMKAGTSTDYIPIERAFDVVGKFRIELLSNEGKPYQLYCIDDAAIIDH